MKMKKLKMKFVMRMVIVANGDLEDEDDPVDVATREAIITNNKRRYCKMGCCNI